MVKKILSRAKKLNKHMEAVRRRLCTSTTDVIFIAWVFWTIIPGNNVCTIVLGNVATFLGMPARRSKSMDVAMDYMRKVTWGPLWHRPWAPLALSERCTLEGHINGVTCLAVLGDGVSLASGSGDKTVRLWNTKTGACTRVLEGHTRAVICLAVLDDGVSLASGSRDNTTRLWNTKTGACTRVLRRHTNGVTCLAVLSDGVTLASGSYDETVRVWNTKTGVCTHVLEGHTNWVLCLAVLGDGVTLASGSWDKTVRLWNTKTGVYTHVLEGHPRGVLCLAVLGDGSLASGYDKTVMLM